MNKLITKHLHALPDHNCIFTNDTTVAILEVRKTEH